MKGPVLTLKVFEEMVAARSAGVTVLACSLDLGLSQERVVLGPHTWMARDHSYPYPDVLKARTAYFWDGAEFAAAARFGRALIKLVPTDWGPPTFEIDGIKMLPTAQVSPYDDAARKVSLIKPRGKVVLDTCAGLGYFAAWCLKSEARQVLSYEKNPDVIWLRGINPWSPESGAGLTLTQGDIVECVRDHANGSIDAVLHDPPRFGIAGELYSQTFYDQLARVMKRNGRLFHYTGTPNRLTSGRDVPKEVSVRLRRAGFTTALDGDGIVAVRL